MAIKTNTSVTLIDDLDGTSDDTVKTRRITFDREMELSDENYLKVMQQLAAILDNGRDVKKQSADSVRGKPRSSRARNARIKAWALANGHPYPARGRRSKELEAAYVAATNDVR